MELLVFGDMQDHAKLVDLCWVFACLRLAAEGGVGPFPHRDKRLVFIRVADLNGDVFALDEIGYLREDTVPGFWFGLRLVFVVGGEQFED